MTREEVLKLTLEASNGKMLKNGEVWWAMNSDAAFKLADAIAQREREACAQVCLTYAQTAFNNSSNNAAMELHDAIKARGGANDTRV